MTKVRIRPVVLWLHTMAWGIMVAIVLAARLGYVSNDSRLYSARFVVCIMPMLSILAFLTGLLALALCEPRKESVTLAVTTIAALLFSLGSLMTQSM